MLMTGDVIFCLQLEERKEAAAQEAAYHAAYAAILEGERRKAERAHQEDQQRKMANQVRRTRRARPSSDVCLIRAMFFSVTA